MVLRPRHSCCPRPPTTTTDRNNTPLLLLLPRTTKGYPLDIEATEVVLEESPVNADLVKALFPKLDYTALLQASRQLAQQQHSTTASIPELPNQLTLAELERDDDDDATISTTITHLYRVLFDWHVLEGHLICPDTGRRFPIRQGIPNMILHEDEL